MNKEKKVKKEKKIIFSETIDSAINGYAVGFSFLGIGVFLLLKPDYFTYPIASYILGAIMGIMGFFGTGIELSKSFKIKGMDNFALGLILLAFWLFMYFKISLLWVNIVLFLFLVLGTYSLCLGFIQSIYSIVTNIKSIKSSNEKSNIKGSIVSQIVLFLTQLCGLALAALNVIKALSS